MTKLLTGSAMPQFNKQVSFVTEIAYENEIQQEDNVSLDQGFQLVSRSEIIAYSNKIVGSTPHAFWDRLMGNPLNAQEHCYNPHVCYLTTDSLDKILQYQPLFINGIDFQHLPKGFYLTKNPHSGGIRNVLHYSEFLANQKTKSNPLAIVLCEKTSNNDPSVNHQESNHRSLWLSFLRSNTRDSNHTLLCSDQELNDALIHFSNLLAKLGLSFDDYSPDFNYLKNKQFNPVVLLGRFATILENKHLKEMDRKIQWENILQLPVDDSKTIRAITDYQFSKTPCGFLLPEMKLEEFETSLPNTGYNTHTTPDAIVNNATVNGEKEFWRFIAYQPARNSIQFYLSGLKTLEKSSKLRDFRLPFLKLLAGCATRQNHSASNQEAEAYETKAWDSFVHLVDTFDDINQTVKTLAQFAPKKTLIPECAQHLTRMRDAPQIYFLESLTLFIRSWIGQNIGIQSIAKHSVGIDPFKPLVEISDKMQHLVENLHEKFYQGAHFYLQKGKWNTLTVDTYIEFQYELYNTLGDPKAQLICPVVSHFSLQKKNIAEIYNLTANFSSVQLEKLKFCLGYFDAMQTKAETGVLIGLIEFITTNQPSHESMLDYLQNQCRHYFEENYFINAKTIFEQAKYGLNPEQIKLVQDCHFSEEVTQSIIRVESGLVKKNKWMKDEVLVQVNSLFVSLSQILGESDLKDLCQRLASLHDYMPDSPEPLKKVLEIILQQKSVETFNQIYLRNQFEQNANEHVLSKYAFFMGSVNSIPNEINHINLLTLRETLASVVLNTSVEELKQAGYIKSIRQVTGILDHVAENHPHVKRYLMDCLTHMSPKNSRGFITNTVQMAQSLGAIADLFESGDTQEMSRNMLTFYSLLAELHTSPKTITRIWAMIKSQKEESDRIFLLNVAKDLLLSGSPSKELIKLLSQFNQNKNQVELFKKVCKTPPYPPISDIMTWLEKGEFEARYMQFGRLPFGKRNHQYGFNLTHYHKQKTGFIGVDNTLFSDEAGQDFESQLKQNQGKENKELIESFNQLKANQESFDPENIRKLICICTEVLARTTSQSDPLNPALRISQEMNTTQIMALYAELTARGNKVIMEIDTGEGKSRNMMLLAACMVAMGKTVDFITSDFQLAERDYLAYYAFFNALGIQSSLISLNTPPELYQKENGINFTTHDLILLRNQSDIAKKPLSYRVENKSNRCLLADEVDKLQHDNCKDAYNSAIQSKRLNGYVWVYPLLVEFMTSHRQNFGQEGFNPANLTLEFVHYVAAHDLNQDHVSSIAKMQKKNPIQLSTWLNSAFTALHMKKDGDYTVTGAKPHELFLVRDHEGFSKLSRKVQVLDQGRPLKGSSFSDGVHQCICAYENALSGKEEIVIVPENEIQRSSYPNAFMGEYEEGKLFGTSGTTRREAPVSSESINYEGFSYLKAPREKALKRVNLPLLAARGTQQHVAFLKQEIIKKIKLGQPVLLICKNDKQSEWIYSELAKDDTFKTQVTKLTRVHAQTQPKDEKEAIKNAGNPGTLTISTVGMFGRGVDVNAIHLNVFSSYIPTTEDEIQIMGRTGRIGKDGTYRPIINLDDPDSAIPQAGYNLGTQMAVKQQEMAIEAVMQEEVSKLYGDFLEKVHQRFFDSFYSCEQLQQSKKLLEDWTAFLESMQKDWDTNKISLLEKLEAQKEEEFKNEFTNFKQKWLEKLPQKDMSSEVNPINTNEEMIYKGVSAQQTFFKQLPKKAIPVQKKYDVSDDGQARIYTSLFAREIATLRGERRWFADYHAWREGRGDLFPDLMATLNGERPLFANLRATINHWIELIKEWMASFNQNEPDPEPSFN